jgi:Fe-S-cluster containining protein
MKFNQLSFYENTNTSNSTLILEKENDHFELNFTNWYQDIIKSAELLIEKWQQKVEKIHCCNSGCSYCCHQLIEVYDFELIAIMEYIRENCLDFILDKAIHISELIESSINMSPYKYSLFNNDDKFQYKKEYRTLNTPCIFLKDNKCLIYPVRPISCLNYYCYTSVNECANPNKMPSGCMSVTYVEEWINSQVNSFLSRNKDSLPHFLSPFDLNILPIAVINHMLCYSDENY